MKLPKLPNMNEFSPGVVGELRPLLDAVHRHTGDRVALVHDIATSTPRIRATRDEKQRLNRASNVLIGMSQCGLVDLKTNTLTGLGEDLRNTRSDADLYGAFARHLLVACHGEDLVDSIESIRERGESVSLQSIRVELRSRGFAVTENAGDASKIRQWLSKAGIMDDDWSTDDRAMDQLVGVTASGLATWRALSRAERAFLEQLRRLDGDQDGWVGVRVAKNLTEEQYGRSVFPEGRLRDAVLAPLESAGWIEARGRGGGRGGDSGQVRATEKLSKVQIPIRVDATIGIPPDLRSRLATPLPTIFTTLQSHDTHEKGIALELLALRLVRDLGLFPVAFRLRGVTTRGAEVDLVADGLHLHYSRWLFQCKNTSTVRVEDIAKEAGMALVLRAHVIVMVTTGTFSRTVTEYANGLAESSPLQAVLLDRKVLGDYRTRGGSAVIDYLRQSAHNVLRLKASQALVVEGST